MVAANDYEKQDDGTVTITIDGVAYRIAPAGDGQVQIAFTSTEPGTVTDALNRIIKQHQRQEEAERKMRRALEIFGEMIP